MHPGIIYLFFYIHWHPWWLFSLWCQRVMVKMDTEWITEWKNYIFCNPTTYEIRLVSLNVIIHKTRKHQRLSHNTVDKTRSQYPTDFDIFSMNQNFLGLLRNPLALFVFFNFAQVRNITPFYPYVNIRIA